MIIYFIVRHSIPKLSQNLCVIYSGCSAVFPPSLPPSLHTDGHTLTEPMKLTRHFRMHNLASSHVRIVRLSVGGAGCEEHRFSVGDCKRLEDVVITTNKSRKIEIS